MDDALCEAFESAWSLLVRGAADRRSPVHTPVVANCRDGIPDQRVMVLRAADRNSAALRFHTDTRSQKCTALDGAPVHVLGYHPGQAIQLRIAGTATLMRDGPLVDEIWARTTPFGRRCYMVTCAPGSRLAAPGSGLPAQVEGRQPSEAELVDARPNFAVLMVAITSIDWLHLAQAGHRRALFHNVDGNCQGEWRVP